MGHQISQARLEDRYYLQKVKLGEGSFGTVWRGVDRVTGQDVAIKQLDKAAMPRRGVREQDIEREIAVMQAVSHPNITKLLDSFDSPSSIYLALEYCNGGDFGDKVKERGLNLEESEAAEWTRQIISAIAALHLKCVVHRDIKPDNFMVSNGSLKLCDFGLAMFLPRGRLLTEKCGTPAFMSPEQHRLPRFSRGYTNLCDIWAAGVTMYMLMFGGRHPFLNSLQQLDETRLLQGSLDFSVAQGFFGFGLSDARYSEPARRLCRRLVEPDMAKRCSAEDIRGDPWLVANQRVAGRQAAPANRPRSAGTSSHAVKLGARINNEGAHTQQGCVDAQQRAQGSVTEPEAILSRKIAALEEQLKMQQEQNESQWEQLVLGKRAMQELVGEKDKITEWQRKSVASEGRSGSASPTVQRMSSTELRNSASKGGCTPQGSPLPVGTRCRYNSSSWSSWMPAVVQGFNESDVTYNLDVRQHARLENISPDPDASASEAWPPGTLVHYESSTVRHWLPSVIRSFNEAGDHSVEEGTYNLDVREFAQVDRMRPRHS